MAATVLAPVTLVCTNAFQDLTAASASGKVRRYDVRAANVGAADGQVWLTLTDGVTTINRAATYPVPFQAAGSAPDLEFSLVLPYPWKIRVKANAGATVEVSATGIEADATDFT